MWRGGEVESVERWGGRQCGEGVGKVQRLVMECTNDACGKRRLGGQKIKGSERWNEEVCRAVVEKRRAFE